MASKRKDGYIIVYVGRDHHLATSQGWAREHRLVAERMLGRRLKPGEVVHHINGIRDDNRPENLHVYQSNAHHTHNHAADPNWWRAPGQENRLIKCACGCGVELREFNKQGERRYHVHGHHLRGKKRQGLRGKILST